MKLAVSALLVGSAAAFSAPTMLFSAGKVAKKAPKKVSLINSHVFWAIGGKVAMFCGRPFEQPSLVCDRQRGRSARIGAVMKLLLRVRI